MNVMGGTSPSKASDFARLCVPAKLRMDDLLDILDDDYQKYMSDREIYMAFLKNRAFVTSHMRRCGRYLIMLLLSEWIRIRL